MIASRSRPRVFKATTRVSENWSGLFHWNAGLATATHHHRDFIFQVEIEHRSKVIQLVGSYGVIRSVNRNITRLFHVSLCLLLNRATTEFVSLLNVHWDSDYCSKHCSARNFLLNNVRKRTKWYNALRSISKPSIAFSFPNSHLQMD